ncbi:hypothetical protein H9Q13_17215 [Pontibacter sp. JH31]|uniref:DNA mismatch repair proteins mutS family domain-containing protein n=1 Tax=Pontibacter aquaedesilientis TaxID=2766980 RepID=A0ABR7XKV2_9BACT|nr:hypothetical protein [Pontibacter aquaedesilientis]MBD1398913.1 hypothetical protein [Pontibacter aquaedesilientis]
MMHVQDLKLEEDVLPFFDYTNNEQSASRLLQMLKVVPSTEALVRERQAITQGMIENWNVLEQLNYKRLDLREVYALLEDMASRRLALDDGKLAASFKLMVFETERNRFRSQTVQIVLMLNGIQRRYLAQLDVSKFPESFRKRLQSAFKFLSRLRLEANAALISENRFTIPRIVAFMKQLQQLDPADIKHFWDFFFSFEAYWSIAKGTLTHSFSFPSFSSGNFKIQDFYHPIVKSPISNTLELDTSQNVLLLTGPNMSGKSTLLKAVGICVYLSHAGFTVPAAACTTPFFHSIAIAINLNDNLRDGYSHFMTEIEHLKAVLKVTEDGWKSFAVFDEIFWGTNMDDALEITKTVVNGLTKFQGSYFLISTHLLQLEEQLDRNSSGNVRKCYIECVLENGLPKFSYTLKDGWSQLRIGRILFEKEGLNELLKN